uniref:Uncharacterized protein n=1 Tax=Nothobranchius furzeri TaxID=105023 RepID=A0A8C6LIT1_NOTFU
MRQLLCVPQTKLYELEGQVRRGAAERGAAETKKMEFQEEIQKQKEQITHIESMYKRQLEGAQVTCSQEKVNFNTIWCQKVVCIFMEAFWSLFMVKNVNIVAIFCI